MLQYLTYNLYSISNIILCELKLSIQFTAKKITFKISGAFCEIQTVIAIDADANA